MCLIKFRDLDGYDEKEFRRIFPNILGYSIPFTANMTEVETLKHILDKNELETLKDVFIKVGQGCKEMLVRCMWEGTVVDCSQIFIETFTTEGICCSFNYNTK